MLVSGEGRNSRRKTTMTLGRRNFLKTMAAAGATVALPSFVSAAGPPPPGSFDFVFFTDTHIQPELDAAHGCDMCFRKIARLNPEFAMMGGDHVFDAFEVNRVRAGMVYDLYQRTEQQLGMPLHHAIGNHDVFGVFARSGVTPSDPPTPDRWPDPFRSTGCRSSARCARLCPDPRRPRPPLAREGRWVR